MKKVSSKKFTVLLALGMSAITCMVCSLGGGMVTSAHEASAEEDMVLEQEEVIEDTIGDIDDGGISVTSTCTPEMPEVLYQYNAYQSTDVNPNVYTYYETYNCFVAYPIQNKDQHAKRIDFSKNNSSTYAVRSVSGIGQDEVYRYIVLPTSENTCYPSLYLISAYCTDCNSRSAINGIIFNQYQLGYNAKCRYGCTVSKTSGTIPTSYDQDGTKWAHGGTTGDLIYFSVAYGGEAGGYEEAACVKIPSILTKSKEITVGGVTFSVRTGPKYVSVKASQTVTCNRYDTVFAFYVKDTD